jgi:hypothetical protein
MNRLASQDAGCVAFNDRVAAFLSPAGLEQFKLDRLLELRAVIDSVRREHDSELLFDACPQAIRNSRP